MLVLYFDELNPFLYQTVKTMPGLKFSVFLKFVTASYVIFILSMVQAMAGNGNIHDYVTRRNKTKRN